MFGALVLGFIFCYFALLLLLNIVVHWMHLLCRSASEPKPGIFKLRYFTGSWIFKKTLIWIIRKMSDI